MIDVQAHSTGSLCFYTHLLTSCCDVFENINLNLDDIYGYKHPKFEFPVFKIVEHGGPMHEC